MIVSADWKTLNTGRAPRVNEEFRGHITDVIGSLADPAERPQAFLVEQEPNWTLRTHYHLQHQFQLVVSGSGTLGRHELAPYTVHYTTPESGYGPIVSGEQGLWYYTIRGKGGRGAHYLPDSRADMRTGLAKAQATSRRAAPLSAAQLAGLSAQTSETLIEPDDSARAAWMLSIPPGASVALPAPAAHGGRFHVVCEGTLEAGGRTVERLGMFHLAAGEDWQGRAGAGGLQLVVLQFPVKLNG